MFDRQRSSKPQLQRKVASKAREELEADAAQKEARLAELRSTMSKEKLEIDKLLSQRGPTLWTSSTEIRASSGTRQALPTKSAAAKAKGGVLTEVSPIKQSAQLPIRREGSGVLKGSQPKGPIKPGPMVEAPAEAARESASYRPSPTKRLPYLTLPQSSKAAAAVGSNQLSVKPSPHKTTNPKAASASSTLQRSSSGAAQQQSARGTVSSGRAAARSPGNGSSHADGGTDPGIATNTDGISRVDGGGASTSGGMAGPSNGLASTSGGNWGGIAAQTDGGGVSSGSGIGFNSGSGVRDNSCGGIISGGGLSSGAGIGSGRRTSVQGSVSPLPSNTSRSPVQVFSGLSLLEGEFNEDDSSASFADALSSWRAKGPSTTPSQSGPNAAPGISTQAGAGVMAKALAAATSPPKQTYFERLLWNQASQEAAASVTGKPARSFADEKEDALQSELPI